MNTRGRVGIGLTLAGSLIVSLVFAAIAVARLDLDDLQPLIALRFSETEWVDPSTLARWLESTPPPVLLDARTSSEYEVSHLRGAVHVDAETLNLDSLQTPDSTAVVVYCSVGYRSAAVVEALRKRGATNLHNLEGGIFRWANEGRPIYRDGEPATKVHLFGAGWGRFLNEELRAP